MKIEKDLATVIDNSLNNRGLSIETAKDFDKHFFDLTEELEAGTMQTFVNAAYMDSHMFLYTFVKMLQNDEVTITFKEGASQKDLNYLERLSECLNR